MPTTWTRPMSRSVQQGPSQLGISVSQAASSIVYLAKRATLQIERVTYADSMPGMMTSARYVSHNTVNLLTALSASSQHCQPPHNIVSLLTTLSVSSQHCQFNLLTTLSASSQNCQSPHNTGSLLTTLAASSQHC